MSTQTQTPRRLGRPRPSLASSHTASSPNLAASYAHNYTADTQYQGVTPHAAQARKASLHQLTLNSLSTIPDGSIGYGLEPLVSPSLEVMNPYTPTTKQGAQGGNGVEVAVGDMVDVPGGMYGCVKFVGSVKAKDGVFAGVELDKVWADRGKNDGDVNGVRYFRTTTPKSGIFVQINRATKRSSPKSSDSFNMTHTTPSMGAFKSNNPKGDSYMNAHTPPTPAIHKFSQSVGPGRAASPQLKPRSRPSLPRPESPLRKQQNALPTTNGRSTPLGRPSFGAGASKNGVGGSRYTPSPAPAKFGQRLKGKSDSATGVDPSKKLGVTPRSNKRTSRLEGPTGSRSSSRFEGHDTLEDEGDITPVGIARNSNKVRDSTKAQTHGTSGPTGDEVERLTRQLEDRDKQLNEQAESLTEMERSFAELQSLLPTHEFENGPPGHRTASSDNTDTSQLRALLKERNEKINMLTADFNIHCADFRSTIETLELASIETERVYEKRVEDLVQEVKELQERGDDVESVALQLKQLEELVQELEEGLEDARRGEAEARGELEFLRGEVERGRSELKREREKAAALLRSSGAAGDTSLAGSKEVEQRDDEIRGLKAIIHSLSRDAVPDTGNPNLGSQRSSTLRNSGFTRVNGLNFQGSTEERMARETLEREVKELESLLETKSSREEELEREVENLRRSIVIRQHASVAAPTNSDPHDRAAMQSKKSSAQESKDKSLTWGNNAPDSQRQGRTLDNMHEGDNNSSDTGGSMLWCEICEAGGHDILTCTNMFGNQTTSGQNGTKSSPHGSAGKRTGRDVVMEGLKGISASSHTEHDVSQLSPAKTNVAGTASVQAPSVSISTETRMVAGKASGIANPNKWCALCERDGHESVDCPFEEEY